jgi:Dual specificity phosphatase, catalytic domain
MLSFLHMLHYHSNCAGRELPNLWEHDGLRYLTFAWQDKASCLLFDPNGFIVVDQIATFIDEATDKGDSVLICSTQGQSRCIACVASYLMHKYRWSAHKSLQFVEAKRPDMELQPSFLRQLEDVDKRLCAHRLLHGRPYNDAEKLRHDAWPSEAKPCKASKSKWASRNHKRKAADSSDEAGTDEVCAM